MVHGRIIYDELLKLNKNVVFYVFSCIQNYLKIYKVGNLVFSNKVASDITDILLTSTYFSQALADLCLSFPNINSSKTYLKKVLHGFIGYVLAKNPTLFHLKYIRSVPTRNSGYTIYHKIS